MAKFRLPNRVRMIDAALSGGVPFEQWWKTPLRHVEPESRLEMATELVNIGAVRFRGGGGSGVLRASEALAILDRVGDRPVGPAAADISVEATEFGARLARQLTNHAIWTGVKRRSRR